MRLQPLYDLQQEINRLFIAGSKFAKGDPRLTRQVAVFNKLGEKAPVFKKIAENIEELTNTDAQLAAEKLTAISSLLYSVLYTQGEMLEEGLEKRTLQPSFQLDAIVTDYSYQQLKPVIQALTETSSGRLDIIKEAMERGVFNDFRTYQYLDYALGDKYSELADYIENKIIPTIGTGMLPYLLNNFDYTDKADQVRRLRLLHTLGYHQTDEIIEKVLSESLPQMQAAAITILVKNKDNESVILKLADDRNKVVRQAAYNALAQLETKDALAKLTEVYSKRKNTGIVVDAIAGSTLPYYFDEVYTCFLPTWNTFLQLKKETPDKEVTTAVNNLQEELPLFINKDREESYLLLEQLLTNNPIQELLKVKKNVLGYTLNNLGHTIIRILQSFDATKRMDFYKKIIPQIGKEEWTRELFRQYFHENVRMGVGQEDLYEMFSEHFVKGYIDIHDISREVFKDGSSLANLSILDKRWINYLYHKVGTPSKWNYDYRAYIDVLNIYSPASDKRFNDLLIHFVKTFVLNEVDFIYALIINRQIENGAALIYENLSRQPAQKRYYYYTYLAKEEFWKKIPQEYADRYRDLYKKNGNELYNEIAAAIELR